MSTVLDFAMPSMAQMAIEPQGLDERTDLSGLVDRIGGVPTAAVYLTTRITTVRSWLLGTAPIPPGVTERLTDLYAAMRAGEV